MDGHARGVAGVLGAAGAVGGPSALGAAGGSAAPRETQAREARAPHVAILDRDKGFQLVLTKRMQRLGWTYRPLSTRASAKTIVAARADVLIVDLALLGARRWRWLARVCEQCPQLQIVVCTGASSVAERVCGLRMGADAWVSKPCHPEELIARVEALTCRRRRPEPRDTEPLGVGEVAIRPDQYQAFVAGRSLRLTRREYQLIEMLARAEGEVLSREEIYESLWGAPMLRNDRSVDVFVHKLRRKLERASPGWRYVHTHFGVGYRLSGEPVDGGALHTLPRAPEPAVASLAA
ncbi:MAG TPA: response regulator transcription factor [Solirubrobacteraceae bacterium]|nr:response regulator transcription factor [Solirubrobacteraceae bacterium]